VLNQSLFANIFSPKYFSASVSFVSFVLFLFFLDHVLFMLSVSAIIMSSLPIASRLVIETQYFMSAAMGAREVSGKLWWSRCFM
jgi:hypothetical protein